MSQVGGTVSTRATNRQIVPVGVLKSLRYTRLLALALVSTGGSPAGQAQQAEPPLQGRDLTQVSIENLMNMEVTSVSRKEQKVSQTAAAIFVITSEDIRRSGMTSIPEVLRMVPGLEVAHIDGSKWAISARGFNDRFVDKLLVLIDGRSLYSSAREGVFWEVQNLLLEDLRPGPTVWHPALTSMRSMSMASSTSSLGLRKRRKAD